MSDSDTNASVSPRKFSKKMIPTRKLIELVKQHRCLWDRMCPSYRERLEKEKAWQEIYREFEPDFDTLSQSKKNFIGSKITRKWHNARDSYVKSRKANMRNRQYLYSDELRFLDATLTLKKANTENNFNEEAEDTEQDGSQNWINEVFVEVDPRENASAVKRPKLDYEGSFEQSPQEAPPKEECDDNIVSVLVNLIHKEEDEDRAFFKSITPSVKRLSDSSRFEFRIQVMKLINSLKMRDRKILKLKRENSPGPETDSE